MAQVIAIANQKGGVGKTTTVINLGAALAEMDKRTLLVDMDPQAALSAASGINPYALEKSIFDVLLDSKVSLQEIIHPLKPNLDLVPASIDLASAEMQLISEIGREYALKSALDPIRAQYDFVLIDSPPSLGLLTINVLTAADTTLIPVQCEYLAMRGLRMLLDTIAKVRRMLNPGVEILGILPTLFDTRTIHSREVLEELHNALDERVFDIVIKKSVRFAEAPVIQQSILEYAPKHDGAQAYRELAEVIVSEQEEKS